MTNRLGNHGTYSSYKTPRLSDSNSQREEDGSQESLNYGAEILGKVGTVVKAAPTACLLGALAVGLAIGFWVKRS